MIKDLSYPQLTHIIDVARTPTSPVCCTLEAGCFTNSSTPLEGFYACAQEGSYVNNGSLTVWVNRIFVVTIFFLWLRLMKYARAFRYNCRRNKTSRETRDVSFGNRG